MKTFTYRPARFAALSPLMLFGALIVFAPPALHAVPLMASSELDLSITTEGQVVISSPTGTSHFRVPADFQLANGAKWEGLAEAETGKMGERTFASATARNKSDGVTTDTGAVSGTGGEALVFARLAYQNMIVQVAPPPVPLLFVPTTVNVFGSVVIDTVGDPLNNVARALAGGHVGGATFRDLFVHSDAGPKEQTVQEDLHLLFIPGLPLEVEVRVGAFSRSGNITTGPLHTSAVASGFIDPVFSFDQQALDELARMQGFAPFDLGTYFAFEQGPFAMPDPGVGVPEPGSMALVLAGGLFLAAALRQHLATDHRRSRSSRLRSPASGRRSA